MNNIISFFKLIRFNNLIIVALTQLIIKFSLINPFLDNFMLSNNQFYLLVLASVFITASGYIINDIYDVKTDKINKEDSRIIGKSITSRNAITWYISFQFIRIRIRHLHCIYSKTTLLQFDFYLLYLQPLDLLQTYENFFSFW